MAISQSAVARVIGVTTEYKNLQVSPSNFLPQRVAVVGQGNDAATYATDPVRVLTATEAAVKFGYGSPLHLAVKQLFPTAGPGVRSIPVTLYPLEAAGGAVAAAGDITPVGTQANAGTYIVRISGVNSEAISIAAGTAAAAAAALITTAINAVVDMPVTATTNTGVVELDAKWSGESGNDIVVEVIGVPDGITFGITQPTGGATNPNVDTALANINSVWETMVVNCLNSDDTTTLDKLKVWGEGRVDPLTNKTAIVFSGSTDTPANLITAGNLRKNDRINSLIPVEASPNLPLQIAARAVARMVVRANDNPPQDYNGLALSGIIVGDESTRWNYTQRDSVVKAGVSTVEIVDGEAHLSDVVTFYHPDGETPPAYQYVVDIVKLQNVQYRTALLFATDEWKGAPLITDNDVTNNAKAKKPKDATVAVAGMIRGLGLNAIVTNVDEALTTIVTGIDETNPKRLNLRFTIQLSGNANIFNVDLFFGFYFGGSV